MSNREKDYFEFRRNYPEFIYSDFIISESDRMLGLEFHFIIPGLAEFRPRWKITKPQDQSFDRNDELLKELVFSLGLVELISYWKITCSPKVRIDCGGLSESQHIWWKKLYRKGLGEFFYKNGINVDDNFMTIISNEKHTLPPSKALLTNNNKVLVPIGGGKDSAVTLEALNGYADRYCYTINPRKAALNTISTAMIPSKNIIIANRTLDENMLNLNRQGFLNGHTPFSALVAFSSVLAAFMHRIKYVALSNESSANESTVLDSDINHQYSKSLEFESDFINYEKTYINSGVNYFSLLRPLTEIGIARAFSALDNYHYIFQSCNIGSKQDLWCANCPKCLFVYIILSPFLEQKKLVRIFGKNMLEDIEMVPIFEKLIGLEPEKPFECVGSCDEVNAAMQELLRQYETIDVQLPKLVEHYKKLNITNKYDINEICNRYDCNNHIPVQFVKPIKNLCNRKQGEKNG